MKKKGFTLIEIMLVVIIIGILASLIMPNFTGKATQAKIASAKTDINGSLSTVLDMYELDSGFFPSTEQGLKALLEKPESQPEPKNWRGPYLKKKQGIKDPWGNDYIYESPGKNNKDYDLSSSGPDGVAGNDDDITNWDSEKSE